jgi:hypothetical protein
MRFEHAYYPAFRFAAGFAFGAFFAGFASAVAARLCGIKTTREPTGRQWLLWRKACRQAHTMEILEGEHDRCWQERM